MATALQQIGPCPSVSRQLDYLLSLIGIRYVLCMAAICTLLWWHMNVRSSIVKAVTKVPVFPRSQACVCRLARHDSSCSRLRTWDNCLLHQSLLQNLPVLLALTNDEESNFTSCSDGSSNCLAESPFECYHSVLPKDAWPASELTRLATADEVADLNAVTWGQIPCRTSQCLHTVRWQDYTACQA